MLATARPRPDSRSLGPPVPHRHDSRSLVRRRHDGRRDSRSLSGRTLRTQSLIGEEVRCPTGFTAKGGERLQHYGPAKVLAHFGHPCTASLCHFPVGEEPEDRLLQGLWVLGRHGQAEVLLLDQLAERIAFSGYDR